MKTLKIKALSLFLSLIMVLGMTAGLGNITALADGTSTWDGSVATAYAGGDGSANNPYQIATADQLAYLAQQVNGGSTYSGKYLILTSDISISGSNWTPIGEDSTHQFAGTFDGAGYKITGLTIGTSDNPNALLSVVGLFGYTTYGAGLKNVCVDVSIYSSYLGSNAYAGDLVGYNYADITNCYAKGAVTGGSNAYVGSLVGYNISGSITNSYSTGAVTGSGTVGGLVGYNISGSITNNYSTGAVTGSGNAGGLVGINVVGTITNSHATGAVAGGSNATVGGLVVNNSGIITNSYATGAVTGGSNATVGGLVGNNSGIITSSYATGAVTGRISGGLVGYNYDAITNSYATCAVTGGANSIVGGLVGSTGLTTITNSYATGAVTGGANSTVGGLAGNNSSNIINGYWNSDATQTINNIAVTTKVGVGNNNGVVTVEATGLPASVMNGTQAPSSAITYTSTNSGNTATATTFLDALNGGRNITGTYADQWQSDNTTNPANGGYPVLIVPDNTISQTTATFDKNITNQADISVSVPLNGNTLEAINNGTTALVIGNDYTVATDGTVTILKAYLAKQSIGALSLTFNFSAGTDPVLIVTVFDSSLTNSTISQTAATFYKSTANQADISVSVTLNGNTLEAINNGTTALVIGNDYTVATNGTVTILKAYLVKQPIGMLSLTFNFSAGTDPVLTINVTEDKWDGSVATAYAGGDGSAGSPYQIATAGQLSYLASQVNGGTSYSGKYFVLTSDISLSGSNWTPIGEDSTHQFYGTFNGSEYKITGLTIGSSDNPNAMLSVAGLFGYAAADATLKNVCIYASIYSSYLSANDYVGGFVGYNNGGTITNSYITGSVTGGKNATVGGLVGYNTGNISSSYTTCTITGVNSGTVGGLVGSSCGSIANSFSTGAVTGGEAGGLVGYNNGGTITNSYTTCSVTGGTAGGLVGISWGAITDSYATGAVTGSDAGGLVGDDYTNGTIMNCHATGAVTGGGCAGGLVGSNESTVTNSYATGAVTILKNSYQASCGGLSGFNDGNIKNSYATGAVTDLGNSDYVGGFVGNNGITITNSYATGAVAGGISAQVGGLAGINDGNIINGYWNSDALQTINNAAVTSKVGVGSSDSGTVEATGLPADVMNGIQAPSSTITYTSTTSGATATTSVTSTAFVEALNGGRNILTDTYADKWQADNTTNPSNGGYPILIETAETPTFSVAAGTYSSAQSVTLSSNTTGAAIYYTTDGTTPTSSSYLYSSPITVSATTTIKAIAVANGMTGSDVASAAYTISTASVSLTITAPASFTKTGSNYVATVTIDSNESSLIDAKLYVVTTASDNLHQYKQVLSISNDNTAQVVISGDYSKAVVFVVNGNVDWSQGSPTSYSNYATITIQ